MEGERCEAARSTQKASRRSALQFPLWRRCGRQRFVRMIMKPMMSPAPMPLFYLLQLLTLFVGELGSHLPMRVGNDLANPSTRISPNLAELSRCFINDRRNFGELFRGKIEFGAERFFHSPADPLGMTQFKEMMPSV